MTQELDLLAEIAKIISETSLEPGVETDLNAPSAEVVKSVAKNLIVPIIVGIIANELYSRLSNDDMTGVEKLLEVCMAENSDLRASERRQNAPHYLKDPKQILIDEGFSAQETDDIITKTEALITRRASS